ncbi:Pentatricopeptide repeat-containing protein family [Quillaja saponaria]|uniref:Pentatricopeptide repeat-containing protein family n=1 Tax=Quillaja saponaria TaxID=32244 RepID=A0AAD7VKX8_QUISA|nr:Pentatricopeptide repeat-containing protein family [Quillaja saponaria]
MPRLSKLKGLIYLARSRHVSRRFITTSSRDNVSQISVQHQTSPALLDVHEPGIMMATLLSNSCQLQELNQIYAHVVRTHFLELYDAPFHWNNIMRAYIRLEAPTKLLHVYLAMMRAGVLPDSYTLPIVLKAVCQTFAIEIGQQVHSVAIRIGLQSNEYCESGFINLYCKAGKFLKCPTNENKEILMTNSLIDMYGKCGRMDLAYKVFSTMEEQNVSSWTSMIVGYAMHGHVKEALECFWCMREAGVRPNHVTFVGVLSACVHGGTVQEGRCYFDMMKNVYGITPQLQHYGCMVDLLGRAGLLEEAKEMVDGMPMKPNSIIWGCLMGACEKYGNVEMGEWVAKHLQILEPWDDGAFVVLSNIYANKGLWKEVEKIRWIMKRRSLAKIPAYSLATNPD